MDKKLKLALVALLGLSTACSSVKNTPKDSKKDKKEQIEDRRIKVMYGVRPPVKSEGIKTKDDNHRIAEEIDPVVEDIKDGE